ncbi:MAG: hypothetical protein HAW66_08410 [Shewanella sp.]|nr:hypothetical protein [Shewanella sp.]
MKLTQSASTHWYNIGLSLGIESYELNNIDQKCGDNYQKYTDVLNILVNSHSVPTEERYKEPFLLLVLEVLQSALKSPTVNLKPLVRKVDAEIQGLKIALDIADTSYTTAPQPLTVDGITSDQIQELQEEISSLVKDSEFRSDSFDRELRHFKSKNKKLEINLKEETIQKDTLSAEIKELSKLVLQKSSSLELSPAQLRPNAEMMDTLSSPSTPPSPTNLDLYKINVTNAKALRVYDDRFNRVYNNFIEMQVDWQAIGLAVGLELWTLASIDREQPDTNAKFREMLSSAMTSLPFLTVHSILEAYANIKARAAQGDKDENKILIYNELYSKHYKHLKHKR